MTRSAPAKQFVYLVQSKGALPDVYASIESDNADLLRLTFKEKSDGAIFYPKSTWTEGRNRLLQEALSSNRDYLYYIFLDEDIRFTKGDWRVFEKGLLRYQPAVATPYYPRYRPTSESPLLHHEAQTVHSFDAMFNAFHRDVVHDRFLLPYHTAFDQESWWYSNMIAITLSQVLYRPHVVQINSIWIDNLEHGAYPQQKAWDKVTEWLEREVIRISPDPAAKTFFRKAFRRIRVTVANVVAESALLSKVMIRLVRAVSRRMRFTIAQVPVGVVSHRLAPSRYERLLRWESPFWRARAEAAGELPLSAMRARPRPDESSTAASTS